MAAGKPADVVAAANVGERFPAPVTPLDRLAPLVRGLGGRPIFCPRATARVSMSTAIDGAMFWLFFDGLPTSASHPL